MKKLGEMMKQAQEMQARMADMQRRLERHEVTGSSGGGMVEVTMTGKGEARRVTIDPKLVEGGDAEMLEDLVVAAVNDAKAKVDAYIAEEMAKVTGGLPLPPDMQLPF